MKKFLRSLTVKKIDVFIYSMTTHEPFAGVLDSDMTINQRAPDHFTVEYKGEVINRTFVFKKVFLLRLVNKSGPVIGDCWTDDRFRGRSIFPFMLNRVAGIELKSANEVFVVVNTNNQSSIRGIEKSGFKKYAHIRTTRFLMFYFNTKIKRF